MKLPTFENPLKLFAPAFAGPNPGALQPSGGHMMFASSGGSGSGGGGHDDDDYGFDDDYNFDDENPQDEPASRRPQSNRTRRSAGRANASGGRSRSASVQPEERYWTDYLRIALPVIGIILMLGLLWIWASNLLGGDGDDVDTPSEDTIGLVSTETPDPNEVNTEPDAASTPAPPLQPGTGAGEIPISGQSTPAPDAAAQPTNPPFNPTATEPAGDNQAAEEGVPDTEAEEPAAGGEIAVQSRVEITEAVNVRPSAGTSGEPLWVAEPGDAATVASGPEEADGYTWWELVFDDGSGGFVIEESIQLIP